jgi:hypothetical protein
MGSPHLSVRPHLSTTTCARYTLISIHELTK